MNIYDQVLKITNNNTKRIVSKLKKAKLWDWVLAQVSLEFKNHCKSETEILYLALHPTKSPICSEGKPKYFWNLATGFAERCNRNNDCLCRKIYIETDDWKNKSATAKIKRKSTFLSKWGVENPSQHAQIQNSKIKTNQEIFGCDWATQSDTVKARIRKTTQDRYGVDSTLQLPSVRQSLQNYRNEHLNEILENTRRKNFEIYGVEYLTQSSNIQSKIKSTNLENCGYEWTTLDPNMKEKSRNTCLEKWGVPNATQRNFSKETLRILNNPDILQKEVNDIGTVRLAIKLDIAFSALYNYMMKHGVTSNHGNQYEKEIEEWLSDNKISFQKHNRSEIKPYELDFYLYEDKKGIEFQGDFWHMNPEIYEEDETNVLIGLTAKEIWERDKHKVLLCENKGIKLFHIWERDWNRNKQLIKDRIMYFIKG